MCKREEYTLSHVMYIAKTIREFKNATDDIPAPTKDKYTVEHQKWYREIVEPYLDFLLWLYLALYNGLFNVKIIQIYAPQIVKNYERIKPYIEVCRHQSGETAWEEIDILMLRYMSN